MAIPWQEAFAWLRDRYLHREIAAKVHVSLQSVWRWEAGRRTPSLPHQRALVAWAQKEGWQK